MNARRRRTPRDSEFRRLVGPDLRGFRSWAAMTEAVGESTHIQSTFDRAAKAGRLPDLRLMVAVSEVTGLDLHQVITAAVIDAGYGHLAQPVDPDLVELSATLREADDDTRAVVRWVASVNRHGRSNSGAEPAPQ